MQKTSVVVEIIRLLPRQYEVHKGRSLTGTLLKNRRLFRLEAIRTVLRPVMFRFLCEVVKKTL